MRTTFYAALGALYAQLYLSSVSAAPVDDNKTPTLSSPIHGPKPPHFVAYSDESQFGIPNVNQLQGFNTLILSFLLASGPADQAEAWANLPAGRRASLKADYKANNITLLASAFGSTEAPTTRGKDPTQLAERMAQWVKDFDLDGIDVDYEDFPAVAKGTAVPWLEKFTTVLRDNLPNGKYVITHAPVAPWFGRNQVYSRLNASVGHLINWYNVQFYSQGWAYTSCESLIHRSGGDFPGTSLLEIVHSGIPQQKVVLGKPANPAAVGVPVGGGGGGGGTQQADGGGGTEVASGDGGTQVAAGDTQVASGGTQVASGSTQVAGGGKRRLLLERNGQIDPHINGFLETNTLAQCLVEAKNEGWNAGVMVWEFPDADKHWIQEVRSQTWPYKARKH